MVSKDAVKRYHGKNILHVGVNFNRSTEPELVEKIESVENRSGYIKELIQADIDSSKLQEESKRRKYPDR